MDDVLENLSEAWVDYLNLKYGTNVSADNVVDWKISQFFPELSEDQVYRALCDDELWKTVRPLDGASEALQSLMRDGHQVYIVTNSHYRTLIAKMENVLFNYFPFLSWDQVIIASHKQMIRGDVLVDDGIHNLIDGDYIKILMDRPYNRSFDADAAGMYRVYDWNDILVLLEQIEQRPSCIGVKIRQNESGGN